MSIQISNSFNLPSDRNDERTENEVEFKARILFFSISAKLESIHEGSEIKAFVRIDHYSSLNRKWKTMEFDGDCYSKALNEIKRIEDYMLDVPNRVCRTPHDALPHLRMLVTTGVVDGSKIALYLELQNKMNAVQVNLAGINESGLFRVDELKRLLAELEDIDIGNCSWEYLESLRVE